MKNLVAILMLAGCAAPPAGQPTADGARTTRSATAAGAPVRVASFARWNDRCEQAGLPTATITAAPAHGALTVREAVLTLGNRLYAGSTRCRDQQVPGIELWYAPTPGFRGTDRMGYALDAGEGVGRFVATVDVR